MVDGRESKRGNPDPGPKPAQGVAAPPLSSGLWLVATPIGNAADITLRALDVLRSADVLAAEDTRRTRQLLEIHGITVGGRPLVSYHDRNGAARRQQILAWLAEGRSVAYASDAGTPLIADPGYRLVEAAREAGHPVHTAPGASSVLAALSVAGLPTDRFLFVGFPPPKAGARRQMLAELADVPATLVFFESPHRVVASVADMAATLGPDREAALVRELTKKFEECRRGSLAELAESLQAGGAPKGEIVLVIGPPIPGEPASAQDLDTALAEALATMSVNQAARAVARDLGLPRREVYARAVALSRGGAPQ